MIRIGVVGALLALTVAACGTAPGDGMAGGYGLVVIGGLRAGEPAPTWNAELERRFRTGVARGDTWTVIVPDGRPTVAGSLTLAADTTNDLVSAASTTQLHEQAERLVTTVRADDPEVDLLAAFDMAGRVLQPSAGSRTVVVEDSLLQTAGSLRFQDRAGALLAADPAGIAARLAASELLPELNDVDVVLTAAGDTAAPQAVLPPSTRRALLALWTAVLEQAGARVRVDPTPSAGGPTTGLPPVTPVPVAGPSPIEAPVVLTDSAVGFLPDVATLRDPAAATAALGPIADALRVTPRKIRLTGTTSSAGTPQGRMELSVQRASAVRGLLVGLGVDPTLIEVRGLGSDFPTFVPDRDATGALDPVRAAENRQVIIEPR